MKGIIKSTKEEANKKMKVFLGRKFDKGNIIKC